MVLSKHYIVVKHKDKQKMLEQAESDCLLLKEFHEFISALRDHRQEGADEVRIVTRTNCDTYPISNAELTAEIQTIVWNHLIQGKRRAPPPHFRIALLRAAVAAAQNECLTAKECQFVRSAKSNDDTSINDDAATQFDLVKLQKFVVNVLEQLLTRLSDNSEAANLATYADANALCLGKCIHCNTTLPKESPPQAFVGFIKNKPRKMEDRYLCLDRYSDLYSLSTPYSMYGVFDGHSGPLAAAYVTAQLPHLMAERLRGIAAADSNNEALYCEAFESAFLQADRMFAGKQITSGTTAVCALLLHGNPSRLFVAWVGDSKALLVSPTASLQLVKPHKPDALEERKRIADSGAAVMFVQGHWRVNGILNVARSIGDFAVSAVIAEPDFVDVQLTRAHDFLVLGTDGLWDYAEESLVVQTAYKAFADPAVKVEDIPKLLVDLAKRGDSQDNITVVVVLLKERAQIVEHYHRSS